MEPEERPESQFAKLLRERFNQLPAIDQKYFHYGSLIVGLSASASGLLSNKIFRETLKVRRGFLLSSLVVTSLPLFQTTILYHTAIPNSIMAGKMNCPLCNTLRGTTVGAVVGGLGSASLAALVSTMYFLKYNKKPLPNDAFRFCINLYRSAVMRMKYFFLFQAVLCMAVSARYYAVYEKMLLMPPLQHEEGPKE
ncbi:transmembrane protein 126A-like [Bufo bufo]|uniref:transmembrane protein 126A-like n=1 Tax=Bufo bufo TaxID=8384 RepID=UPI001ABE72D3|nr:transmembrane protein 126A-like [Bufo bufo]XP_040282328.1 transmembrane protein 126A-like [Bufo bufo]XP_040282329.1 transmembrane protein 126A-like [Bufo bufo]